MKPVLTFVLGAVLAGGVAFSRCGGPRNRR